MQQNPPILQFGHCRMPMPVVKPQCLHMLMITISTDFCNTISLDFYDNTIATLQFHQLTCSCGHSGCLTIHGYYDRCAKSEDGFIRLHICVYSVVIVEPPMHYYCPPSFFIPRFLSLTRSAAFPVPRTLVVSLPSWMKHLP